MRKIATVGAGDGGGAMSWKITDLRHQKGGGIVIRNGAPDYRVVARIPASNPCAVADAALIAAAPAMYLALERAVQALEATHKLNDIPEQEGCVLWQVRQALALARGEGVD